MMFEATYSPADANNKRKETKWAVFSLCKMSVEMDGLKEPASSHTGQPVLLGPLIGVLPEMAKGVCSFSSLRPGAVHQSWN